VSLPRKHLFELPDRVIYLDGNSLGPVPKGAAERAAQVITHEWGDELIRAWNTADWISLPKRVGDRIARLIGAPEGSVATGDTLSIKVFQALAAALKMRPDRRIILSDSGNFPTDLYMAQGLIELVDRSVYPADEFPAGQWEYMRFYEENFERATTGFEADPYNTCKALFRAGDYGRAGVPMLPNVAGIRSTQHHILAYSVLLAILGVTPWAIGLGGPAYGVVAAIAGLNFIRHAWQVWRMDPADQAMMPAKKLFGYSIFYLFLLFLVLAAEALIARAV